MDTNVGHKIGIAAHHPGFTTPGCRGIKVNNLGKAMNTGIGAAGAVNSHRLVRHAC